MRSVHALWRLRAALRWLRHDLARRAVECIARIPTLRRLPRAVVAPIEAQLVRTARRDGFDAAFYLARNPDVAGYRRGPLAHYLRHGWREGRAPRADWDDAHYRAAAGLRPACPVSPLAHYIAFGRRRGLRPIPAPEPCAPATGRGGSVEAILDNLPPRAARVAEVDVLMPVYAGREITLSAIFHVLTAHTETPFELIVIDDCGPDADLRADIARLADAGCLTLLRQPRNRGFVSAINAGSALHSERDVVWLNADTEVYDGWLDRLAAAALSWPNVATVTPFTNNGTICSYPRIDRDNGAGAGIDGATIDRLAAEVNNGIRIETPTAVGFATYVRRAALDALGGLDEGAFGRGYGEENDFSQRAIAAGWANLIAADVYVHHKGSVSFGGERAARVEAALDVLERRWPNYHRDVHAFLRSDPLAQSRARLDRARLLEMRGQRNVLLVAHSLGGGTEQHVQEEIAKLTGQGWSVFLMRGGADGPGTARLGHADAAEFPSLDALDVDGEPLWETIAALDLDEIHVHHVIDFGQRGAEVLCRRMSAIGAPWQVVVHDWFAICPRINLADRSGMYCGEPGQSACRRCLRLRGSPVGHVDISDWRQHHGALFAGASLVRVPDRDVRARLLRYFPDLARIEVRPHESLVLPLPVAPRSDGPLRIATIGAIGPIKGFDVLLDLAVQARRAPGRAEVIVIGHTRCDRTARAAGIEVTGPYRNAEVAEHIAAVNPDVILLPALWPETYSYTLSIALGTGLPVVAFDIGAIATRLRDAGRGHLVPLAHARDAGFLLEEIERAAGRLPAALASCA